jgi:hypothetical protein
MGEQGLAAHTQTRINPWEDATMHVAGSDPRTVKKYLILERRLGRIKSYAGNVWEIV